MFVKLNHNCIFAVMEDTFDESINKYFEREFRINKIVEIAYDKISETLYDVKKQSGQDYIEVRKRLDDKLNCHRINEIRFTTEPSLQQNLTDIVLKEIRKSIRKQCYGCEPELSGQNVHYGECLWNEQAVNDTTIRAACQRLDLKCTEHIVDDVKSGINNFMFNKY